MCDIFEPFLEIQLVRVYCNIYLNYTSVYTTIYILLNVIIDFFFFIGTSLIHNIIYRYWKKLTYKVWYLRVFTVIGPTGESS